MGIMVRLSIKLVFAVVVLVFGWHSAGMADRVPVFVSIAPQSYFVQQIGKDRVDVHVMVAPGASPHTYEPKPGQMATLSQARLYFAIGIGFEDVWLKRIAAANPQMQVVHTDHGIQKLPMADHHHHDDASHGRHSGHGHAHQHTHGPLDPHIWLSPPLVKVQARTILSALKAVDPAHADVYEANYRGFLAALDALDADLKAAFADKQGMRFMVFHPSWGYFADTYGLQQVPIEIQGKDPKPAQLQGLIEHAREEGIRVIFVQPQFSARSAEVVAREIGGQVAFADPLADDWELNLRAVADKFQTALQ